MTPAEALSQIETELREATPGPWEVGVTYNYDRNATLIAHAPTYLAALVKVARAASDLKQCIMTSTDLYDHTFVISDDATFVNDARTLRTALDAFTKAVEG